MFTNKKTIIFLTKSKIKITSVTLGNKPKENVIAESDWNFDNLLGILSKYRKTIGKSVRLLLSEDFVYVVTFSLPFAEVLGRDVIREKAQEFIPENLNETIWDFKEVERKILVSAAVKERYGTLSEIIIKSGLHIETIEPLSFSFTRLLEKQVDPILFVYLYDKAYLTLAQKDLVLATERLNLPINKEEIKKFILFAKENLKISPRKIIFCGNTQNLDLKEYEKEGFKIQMQELSPIISLAYKQDVKDKDKKVLNLELLKFSYTLSLTSN
ncbi:hypothetical protein HYT32_00420 [Candidatus Roizmanbacteria bacterium]|nr:hypothetical protein [Candidatus Roizmanbacteria bacterium]